MPRDPVDEYLARFGPAGDARTDRDRDSGDLLVEQLAFARVQPRPDVEVQLTE